MSGRMQASSAAGITLYVVYTMPVNAKVSGKLDADSKDAFLAIADQLVATMFGTDIEEAVDKGMDDYAEIEGKSVYAWGSFRLKLDVTGDVVHYDMVFGTSKN